MTLYVDMMPQVPLLQMVLAVTNLWQVIEARVETAIWGLADLNEIQGRAITAHMTFPLRCDVLRSLYHVEFADAEIDKALNKLIEKVLKPAASLRNKYAHAMWLKDELGQSVFLQKEARGKPTLTESVISVVQLDDEMLRIFAAYLRLDCFLTGADPRTFFDENFSDSDEEPPQLSAPVVQIPLEPYLRPTKPNRPRLPPRSSPA